VTVTFIGHQQNFLPHPLLVLINLQMFMGGIILLLPLPLINLVQEVLTVMKNGKAVHRLLLQTLLLSVANKMQMDLHGRQEGHHPLLLHLD
jgi:DNA-binding transcriptional regulator/RsmH inhibitor MraZ